MPHHKATSSDPLMGGTDGFRDKIVPGSDPTRLNPTTAAHLAAAFVETTRAHSQGAKITCVIGGDTRPSTPALEQAAVAGAESAGARVIRMGVAPTPAIQWTADRLGADISISVTASHNPASDNGIKLMDGSAKPDSERVKEYSERYWQRVKSGVPAPTKSTGTPNDPEHLDLYIKAAVQDIEAAFDTTRPLEGKTFVVDGANGATMSVTPQVLRALGATVEEFACDGARPINDRSGAAHPEGVREFMSSPRGQEITNTPGFVGVLSNDGDGDRLIGTAVHSAPGDQPNFQSIDGNHMLMLLAEGEPGVVGTEYTNPSTVRYITQNLGVQFEYCANGDRFVTQKLRQKGWKRGGEFTGHLIDLDWLSSGDGIRMGAWLAAYAAVHNKTFTQIADALPLSPEKLTNVKMGSDNKGEFSRPDVQAEIAAAKAALGKNGRIVTRESGTENVYRIWAAGENKEDVETAVRKIATTLAFPKILAEKRAAVNIEDLDQDGQEALALLRERGYDLFTGLTVDDLPELAKIADEDAVQQYCPRDSEERFGGTKTPQESRVEMARAWHKKGRLFLQLRKTTSKSSLAGYGWTGPDKHNPTPEFAIRVSKDYAGQGIGTLLTRVIVSVTRMRTNGSRINLGTYGSNGAQYAYLKAGAIKEDGDPQLIRRRAGRNEKAEADGLVSDTRIRMYFPAVD